MDPILKDHISKMPPPKYRISTFLGDDYRSDNELVVECDSPTARKLLPLWQKDAPNLTECRVIYADRTLSSFCIVAFDPEIVLSPDPDPEYPKEGVVA